MYKSKKVYAIVLAAGHGTRIGFDKMLYRLDGEEVVKRSVKAFSVNEYVDEIIVTASENIQEITRVLQGLDKISHIVTGGATRAQSVMNALQCTGEDGLVAIHDGARPFVSQQVINDALEGGYASGRAIPCVKVKDTIKESDGQYIGKTYDRSRLYTVQTPQVFSLELYKELAEKYFDESITDDAQLFEKGGIAVAVTQGDYENYKITTIDDIKEENKMRIGHGYDVHKLVEGRDLIMGGVNIPYEKGLLGHSDADVVLHAVMDSLLGALALGDIGKHFPDSDDRYKGIDSMELLRNVAKMLEEKGATVGNLDVTILCQRPKLAPHIVKMRENIAGALHCDVDRVSVKATTEEGLGFTGEGLGIACHAVCLLETK